MVVPMAECPRCHNALEPGAGALGEDVCTSCGGRALSPAHTRRLIEEELGLSPSTLKELASHFGGVRLTCSHCGSQMSPVTLRSVPIDLCLGCGTTFFDDGELSRLSKGVHREVTPVPPKLSGRAQAIADMQAMPDVKDPSLSPYPVIVYATEREHDPDAQPLALWERALPMAMLEGALLYVFFSLNGISFGRGSPLDTYFSAFGLVAIPLLLSMFVNADLRSYWPKGGRFRFSLGTKGFMAGFLGVGLAVTGVAVGGVFSTLNAMLAEKYPRLLNMKTAIAAGGVTFGIAVLQTLFS
jgi:Zn-finger nucleic acid-binding protein